MKRYALVVESDHDGIVVDRNVGDAIALRERVTIGRRRSCEVVIEHHMVNPTNCILTRTPHGWIIQDTGGTNGVWVNERRISGRQLLSDGDAIMYHRVRLALRAVSDDPFARLGRFRSYALFGTRTVDAPGRRRAFRSKSGAVERALIVTHALDSDAVPGESPLHAPVVEEIRDGDFVHRVYADHAGVSASRFLATEGSMGDTVRTLVGAVLDGDPLLGARRCVVTWDGDVFVVPALRSANPVVHGEPTRIDRATLADVVRNLFPNEWERERLLREQLDTLDDAGIAWLLERGDAG